MADKKQEKPIKLENTVLELSQVMRGFFENAAADGSEPYEFIESMKKDWGAEVQTVKAEEDIKGIEE